METEHLFLVGALAFASASGFFCVGPWVGRALRRRKSGQGGNCSFGMRNELQHLLSCGIRCAVPFAKVLLRKDIARDAAQEAVLLFQERGYGNARAEGVVCVVLVALVGWVLFGALALGSLLSAIAVALGALSLATFQLRSRADKRMERARLSVPDSIQAMKSCFQAGFSLEQALGYLAQHSCPEMAGAFAHALQTLQMGGSSTEALNGLREEVHAPEFAFVMVALEIQHRTGGSLAHVLGDAEQAARGQFELERSLRVQTAQARLSARVVSVMPIVLVGVFSLVSEGFMEPFFTSLAGFLLFMLAVGMQVIGIFMVRKTLKVKGVAR